MSILISVTALLLLVTLLSVVAHANDLAGYLRASQEFQELVAHAAKEGRVPAHRGDGCILLRCEDEASVQLRFVRPCVPLVSAPGQPGNMARSIARLRFHGTAIAAGATAIAVLRTM